MECDVIKKNLGVSRCNKMPEMLVGMITTPNDFVIPSTRSPILRFYWNILTTRSSQPRETVFITGQTLKASRTFRRKPYTKTVPSLTSPLETEIIVSVLWYAKIYVFTKLCIRTAVIPDALFS